MIMIWIMYSKFSFFYSIQIRPHQNSNIKNNSDLQFFFGYAPDGNKSFVPVRWSELASPWLQATPIVGSFPRMLGCHPQVLIWLWQHRGETILVNPLLQASAIILPLKCLYHCIPSYTIVYHISRHPHVSKTARPAFRKFYAMTEVL